MFLLGRTLALNELEFDSGEQRHLNELLTQSSSESTVPYLVGLAEFLSKTMPIISSSFELLFDKYRLIQTRSVDVVLIGHRSNVTYNSINDNVPNTRSPNSTISGIVNIGDSIMDDLRESFSGHHTIYFTDVTSKFYF